MSKLNTPPIESQVRTENDGQWPVLNEHRPLDVSRREIRLLRINPTTENSLITFTLAHASRDDSPDFCAVLLLGSSSSKTQTECQTH